MTHLANQAWLAEARAQAAALWQAPTTLDAEVLVEGVPVWVWIQGRQDRVHGLVDVAQARSVLPQSLGVNWAWCVLSSRDVETPAGWGSLLVAPDGWRVLRPAPAIPGIFLRRHADVFRAWKTLSDF